MTDSFYRRLDSDGDVEVFSSTESTASNWSSEIQHGSPPLALLTKAVEELAAPGGQRIGRLTLDILGAIPVAPVRVRAWTMRPGPAFRCWAPRCRRWVSTGPLPG